ncbi:MAG: response regulator [Bacteroidota bacterium]
MSKQTILVVDDEDFNRKIIIDILVQSKYDYSVLSANNGKIGCELAEKFMPDLILMDWKMPEMTGIEAIKQLKSREKTKDIPVLMITAVTSPEKLQEAFGAGVVDYITKPVKEIELLVRIRSVLKTNTYYKEIIRQKEEIESQKKDITDSIRYAQHIQKAILPKIDEIQSALVESFVLFKPKDIVSGDFFWFTQKKKIFIAACDCTGHGVPGAFVSMIGNVLLNQIIIEKGIDSPAKILSLLNNEIKSVFTRKGSEQQASDGMDITLCAFDKDLVTLEFAGAQNPLFLIRKGELIDIKGDRQPIGGSTEFDYNFTNHEIELQKGDNIYIFSDGYPDQIGGPKERKFMSKQFKQLLLDIQGKSMEEQKQILGQTIEKWKGELDQIDDILVIGVRV